METIHSAPARVQRTFASPQQVGIPLTGRPRRPGDGDRDWSPPLRRAYAVVGFVVREAAADVPVARRIRQTHFAQGGPVERVRNLAIRRVVVARTTTAAAE